MSRAGIPGARSQEKVVRVALENIKGNRPSKLLRYPLQLPADRQGKRPVSASPNQKQRRQGTDGLRIAVWKTAIDQHQSVNVGSPDRSGRSNLRAEGDSEDTDLTAVVWLTLKKGGHTSNGGNPVRQSLRIIGDARLRSARRGDCVKVGHREDMNEIGIQAGRPERLADLIKNGRSKTFAAA
ncbi:hypothetical protein J2W42_005481 [Rhizobium tibeticum]|nr:hypothetical protein [Rhizobium tibeticum]